ncbi:hypothetical protein GCM10023149_11040 [Mucilaginibacter gynuensis]|uniref:Uncharacterized protein n=1 Tax=Mucilaginibacter gynuensis TaxID=1302236 RepID=A0ABP8G0X0_9SPHI
MLKNRNLLIAASIVLFLLVNARPYWSSVLSLSSIVGIVGLIATVLLVFVISGVLAIAIFYESHFLIKEQFQNKPRFWLVVIMVVSLSSVIWKLFSVSNF